jgi:hypothetical protein
MTTPCLHDRLRRPWAVWLALCVALLGALAVPMAHAVPRGDPIGLLEICTSSGPQSLPAGGNAPPKESAPFLSHCPFCLHHADACAPPPHLLPYLFSVSGGQQGPRLWQAFLPASPDIRVPPSRGPPRCA